WSRAGTRTAPATRSSPTSASPRRTWLGRLRDGWPRCPPAPLAAAPTLPSWANGAPSFIADHELPFMISAWKALSVHDRGDLAGPRDPQPIWETPVPRRLGRIARAGRGRRGRHRSRRGLMGLRNRGGERSTGLVWPGREGPCRRGRRGWLGLGLRSSVTACPGRAALVEPDDYARAWSHAKCNLCGGGGQHHRA